MARLWLAGYSQDEIADQAGVPRVTFVDFLKPAKIDKSGRVETEVERLTRLASCAGRKVDPEFTDLDPPLYDVWKAKTSAPPCGRCQAVAQVNDSVHLAAHYPWFHWSFSARVNDSVHL